MLFAGLIQIRTIRITTCYMRKNMTVQYDRFSLCKDWLTQSGVDSCGKGCAQLDDFK